MTRPNSAASVSPGLKTLNKEIGTYIYYFQNGSLMPSISKALVR